MPISNFFQIRWSFLFFILCLLFVPSAVAAFRYLEAGMEAPAVTGKDIRTGNTISSDTWLHRQIVVIVFWATWSERSINELSDLKEIQEEYSDFAFQVIAVNVEAPEISEAIEGRIHGYIEELQSPYPIIIDNNLTIFNDYGVIAVPSTAIIDTAGKLRYAPAGYSLSAKDNIIDSIKALLGMDLDTGGGTISDGYTPDVTASRYYRLAVRMWNQRLYEEALSNLELSIENDTLFGAPHNLRGQVFLKLESPDTALEAFQRALKLDSLSPANWTGYGRALMLSGEYNQALEYLNRALQIDNSFTPALLNLAICLSEIGDIDRAFENLEKAKALNPNDPMLYYHLGKINKKNGQPGKAAINFRRALELLLSP